MKPEAIRLGRTIVRDPGSTIPQSRSYYRITERRDDGQFVAVNITSRTSKRFAPGDIKRLVPASDTIDSQVDLSALMGRKVIIELSFGKTEGYITEVVFNDVTILGVVVSSPVSVSLDGEMIRYAEIRGIEAA